MKTISIVGLGYIGLPTALVAAQHNLVINGFDLDENKVTKINDGIAPIIEPGIEKLLSIVQEKNKFFAATKLEPADCFVIAVPTPFKQTQNGLPPQADLSSVFEAGKTVAQKLKPGDLVILESTCPVGTTQKLATILEKHSGLQAKQNFFLAYCPERVLPGKIIEELVSNDRIIGGICKESARRAKQFYKTFVKGNCVLTTDKVAEMVKLVENSSRDVQIALANQIGGMCEAAGISPFEVIELANLHPRVNVLQPGCGVGGHCIAVDPWFLVETFPENTQLLKTAREINDQKPYCVINQVVVAAKDFFKTHGRKPNVLALGLTFKPDVDDLRQSPALQIALALNGKADLLNLATHDPFVKKEFFETLGLNHRNNFEKECEKADIIVALVKHTAFKKINSETLCTKMVIDPCGLFYKQVN